MFTAALASVNVLFTDDEMARCNTSGTKDFQQLDSGKSGFLVSVLQRKFDSLCLSEQWNQIAACINTKCRGRGGLLFTDLRKLVCFENTEMAQLVYHLTWKHYGSVNWTEFSRCSTKLLCFYHAKQGNVPWTCVHLIPWNPVEGHILETIVKFASFSGSLKLYFILSFYLCWRLIVVK